jgi:hypothetical protein
MPINGDRILLKVTGEGGATGGLNEAPLHFIDMIGCPGPTRSHGLGSMTVYAIHGRYAIVPIAIAADNLMPISIIIDGAEATIPIKVKLD